jgi:methionyl-tRNA formyltransferase
MRIAYVGSDFFANRAQVLLDRGHTISHIFTSPSSAIPTQLSMGDIANRCGIRPVFEPVSAADIARLSGEVDLLICAGYAHRIPIGKGGALRAINLHPSPLPIGRGPSPFQHAILKGLKETAVSIHEMVERFDAGPILLQRSVPIGERETAASLAIRCRAAAPAAMLEVVESLPSLWAHRQEQGTGSYWKRLSEADRTIDWTASTEQIDRILRAFPTGSIHARLRDTKLVLYEASCWPEAHTHRPGSIVASSGAARLVAAADGFVYLRSYAPLWQVKLRSIAGRLRSIGVPYS